MPPFEYIYALNIDTAKALGLEVENLRSFSVECAAGCRPVVTAEYVVLGNSGLKAVTKRYRLKPSGDGEKEAA